MKYLRSTKLGYKIIEIRKSEFVAKTQLLWPFPYVHSSALVEFLFLCKVHLSKYFITTKYYWFIKETHYSLFQLFYYLHTVVFNVKLLLNFKMYTIRKKTFNSNPLNFQPYSFRENIKNFIQNFGDIKKLFKMPSWLHFLVMFYSGMRAICFFCKNKEKT